MIDKVQDARLSAGMKALSFSGTFCRVFHLHSVSIMSEVKSGRIMDTGFLYIYKVAASVCVCVCVCLLDFSKTCGPISEKLFTFHRGHR